MNASTSQRVNRFLADLQASGTEFANMVMDLRDLFLDTKAGLKEEIKYGGILFTNQSGPCGGIFVYRNHISIEFSHGAQFDDPDNLLQGGGKYRRHIRLRTHGDLATKTVADFIKQAVRYAPDKH